MVILIFVIEEVVPMMVVLDWSFMEIFVIHADINNFSFVRGAKPEIDFEIQEQLHQHILRANGGQVTLSAVLQNPEQSSQMSSISPDFRFTNLGAAPGVAVPPPSTIAPASQKKTWGSNFFKKLSARHLMGAIGIGTHHQVVSPTRHSQTLDLRQSSSLRITNSSHRITDPILQGH